MHMMEEVIKRMPSSIHLLILGKNENRIICNACQYEPISFEPFSCFAFHYHLVGDVRWQAYSRTLMSRGISCKSLLCNAL